MKNFDTEHEIKIPVTKIQKFCTHDGPGVRTVVFFKGCPLRCVWCHNPETRSTRSEFFLNQKLCIGCGTCLEICPGGVHSFRDGAHLTDRSLCKGCMRCADVCPSGAVEACSRDMTVDDIMKDVLRDRDFYANGGGITVSGGEPTVHPEGLIALLKAAKSEGINTAVETCGYFDRELLRELVPLTDLFLWDLKDGCDARYIEYTGVSNVPIIENLRLADSMGAKTRLRCILVSGVNNNKDNYSVIAQVYKSLNHCEGVEILPYHLFGSSKSTLLGMPDSGREDMIPTKTEIRLAKSNLVQLGVKLIR